MRYSGLRLLTHAIGGNKGWTPAWRDPPPKPVYDVIIIGGDGHGLATAYYLAKEHGVTNVAVREKGPIGLGDGELHQKRGRAEVGPASAPIQVGAGPGRVMGGTK
jgi:hypothetical protein